MRSKSKSKTNIYRNLLFFFLRTGFVSCCILFILITLTNLNDAFKLDKNYWMRTKGKLRSICKFLLPLLLFSLWIDGLFFFFFYKTSNFICIIFTYCYTISVKRKKKKINAECITYCNVIIITLLKWKLTRNGNYHTWVSMRFVRASYF